MGCRSMDKVDSRRSIPRLRRLPVSRRQDFVNRLKNDFNFPALRCKSDHRALQVCNGKYRGGHTNRSSLMGASVMGLFRHSLSIFGGDYVICRIFLQSARMVVIRRTYNALGGAWVGIWAYSLERLRSLRHLKALGDELFVGTPDRTLCGGSIRSGRGEMLQH